MFIDEQACFGILDFLLECLEEPLALDQVEFIVLGVVGIGIGDHVFHAMSANRGDEVILEGAPVDLILVGGIIGNRWFESSLEGFDLASIGVLLIAWERQSPWDNRRVRIIVFDAILIECSFVAPRSNGCSENARCVMVERNDGS